MLRALGLSAMTSIGERVARGRDSLIVRGVLEQYQGVTNLQASKVMPLDGLAGVIPARNFR